MTPSYNRSRPNQPACDTPSHGYVQRYHRKAPNSAASTGEKIRRRPDGTRLNNHDPVPRVKGEDARLRCGGCMSLETQMGDDGTMSWKCGWYGDTITIVGTRKMRCPECLELGQ
jgi:hypothetical protein